MAGCPARTSLRRHGSSATKASTPPRLTLPLAYGGFTASNVLVPQWLQLNMGYTATWAGYVSGMTGVLAIFAAPLSAKLSGRFDPRFVIFGGVMWLAWITFMRAGATSQ